MRRLVLASLVILGLAWWAWPYAGALRLAQAAMARDLVDLPTRIDEPALKRSLSRQIVGAYLRRSGRGDRMGALERGLANSVGASIAGPYLDQLLAPDTLATLLGQGRMARIEVDGRTLVIDRELPSLASLYRSHLSYVVLHSAYDGIASFRFAVPATPGGDAQYGLHFRLAGLTWRLAGIDLPPDVLDHIADDAIAAEKASGSAGR